VSGRRRQIGKEEGGLDLDICPGAPEILVTPLGLYRSDGDISEI